MYSQEATEAHGQWAKQFFRGNKDAIPNNFWHILDLVSSFGLDPFLLAFAWILCS